MTTSRVERNTVLVSEENLLFIRPITIRWSLSGCKPNTRLYPYFDQQDITIYVKQDGKDFADPIITDAQGSASGIFELPGNTFRTGERELIFSESKTYSNILLNFAGSITGYARAVFTSNGIRRLFQTTETRITVVTNEVVVTEIVPPPPRNPWVDPIAQSFNTFNLEGGCYLHSIDLYFKSKDDQIPIEVSIVGMRYGYPSNDPSDFITRKIVPAAVINVSDNASVATRIYFDNLVYLQQDQEYAFVVFSNSNQYYLFTSYLGETSIENRLRIFEQPYLGSLFKSQNNSTWTAVQEEDLKFAINICNFDTSVSANLNMELAAPSRVIASNFFETTNASNQIIFHSIQKHGFEVGNKFELSVPPGTYNGISHTNLKGSFTVVEIIDEFKFKFQVAQNATSTGKIEHGGVVRDVTVLSPGYNYDAGTTISFVGGGGTGATAEPIISDGKLIGIKLTSGGSGYTSAPTVVINSAAGGGATASSSLDTVFTYTTNTVFNEILPALSMFVPENTGYSGEIDFKLASYHDAGIVNYSTGKPVQLEQFTKKSIKQNGLIANSSNKDIYLGGNPSGTLNLVFKSSNNNVSPVINRNSLSIWAYENIINNQLDEDIYSLANSELDPEDGNAIARYITVPQRLLSVNTGVRFICNLYSTENTSVDVYFKGSQSSAVEPHTSKPWVLMNCDIERNLSKSEGQFFDYNFYINKFEGGFDVFQYKIVLRSKFPWEVPIVRNYRSIILL